MKKSIQKIVFLVSLLFFFALNGNVFAQSTATITGKVTDYTTREALIGVTVIHKPSQSYAITDADGKYTISIPASQKITIEYILTSYATKKIMLNLSPSQKIIKNITLTPPVQEIITIRGRRSKSTSSSLIQKRKKSIATQDAISTEEISRSTDSNVASVSKRVTGLNVLGGKYVYIRGLGERYSSVLFNNAFLTSPNPEKRIIPLDIFPNSVLSNLTIYKTYVPSLPGHFSGGNLLINSKDIEEEATIAAKIGIGYNHITTFQDFYSHKGSDVDFLGFGSLNQTRNLPCDVCESASISEKKKIAETFPNNWNIFQTPAIFGGSFSFLYSNTFFPKVIKQKKKESSIKKNTQSGKKKRSEFQ